MNREWVKPQAKDFLDRLRESLAEPEPKEPRFTKKDIERFRERIKRTIEDHEARLDWEAGGEPDWTEKTKKKPWPGSGHVM